MDYIGKEIRRNPLVISGSDNSTFLKVETAASGSTAIFTNNVQNGYPTSNPWKENLEGSFFNNFDNTTHVSEILRFMSGVMSHSLDVADAAPNTFTFASVDTNENNLGTTDSISGVLPTNYTGLSNDTLNYLVTKGFVSVGSTIFDGISVYHDNGGNYSIDFDSNKGGSSIISSSADSELFGLGGLTSGGATVFKVRIRASQSFSDNASNIANFDINDQGQIISVTDPETYQFLSNLHESQLRSTFESVLGTNSLQVVGVRETMKVLADTSLNFISSGKTKQGLKKIENLPTEENERRIGKIYSANLGGVKGYYLWGGNLQNSILIEKAK